MRPIPSGSTEVLGTFGGTALTEHGPGGGRVEAAAYEEHAEPLQGAAILGDRPPAEVPFERCRRPLLLDQRGITSGVCPERFDDRRRNALRAQLGLECHPTARRVSVALLHPPPGEGDIVDQADAGQTIQGGADDAVRGARAT
ncbi:MAG: hypothetical protein M3537_03835 [Chloroflexota bacterium]|nr:hypothetical protein [Chloroflexota bacterium]